MFKIAKELIKKKECRIFEKIRNRLNNGKIVKFQEITEKSKDILVNDYEKSVWDILRNIRKAIVHNDGFFAEDDQATYTLGNRVIRLEYKRNEPLIGDLDLLLILVEILLELYYRWIEKFLELK